MNWVQIGQETVSYPLLQASGQLYFHLQFMKSEALILKLTVVRMYVEGMTFSFPEELWIIISICKINSKWVIQRWQSTLIICWHSKYKHCNYVATTTPSKCLGCKGRKKTLILRTDSVLNGANPVFRNLAESQLFWMCAVIEATNGSRWLFERKFYGPECKSFKH